MRAVLAGIAVALISGLVGCFVVWRRMSYYGESIAHSSLLGVGLGILLGTGINFGVIIICLLFGILFLWLQQSKILSTDTLLGVLAHLALSIGIIVISLNRIKIDIEAFLFGDILTVSSSDLWIMYLGVGITILLILINWSSLLLVTIDEDLARAEGINPIYINLLLTIVLTIVVAVSLQIIGLLLITAMLIIPAATSRRLANSPGQMALIATLVGVISVISGIFLSVELDAPSGPSIVVISAILFFLSYLFGLMQKD
ncbi:metal ABC transporter permease [Alphaproteobacteria bacterium]|jgi:zinc transport system permease protein|nr:metal ABC transporter permease [Alphaproteobacteria bacterium]MDB3916464.1 metal ABC transporter permease [Alphaproteobacteria bacterium]MDC0969076.1 metal ABC transporter permease [Alphaproteobacteria bacterium]MDC1035368.1 metal ABC transporter permease [Alphaproteobacteria bacterium]MDC3410013.1 metal ABC transporter permease [Alphaproteobacteria bacterium]